MKRAVLLLALIACGHAGQHVLPSPSPSVRAPSPPASSPSALSTFDASRAYEIIRTLSATPREDSEPAFARAVSFVADTFRADGYAVRLMSVPIPSGKSAGHRVAAGSTTNVIATPVGFDPAKPHLIAGAHLDTVYGAPGAVDNASGVAVMLECARIASMSKTAMPVEWIAFGGEERRSPGPSGALFGSRALLSSMPRREKDSLRGMIAIDVIGKGSIQLSSGGVTPHMVLQALHKTASRLGIAVQETIVTRLFSDHKPFEEQGFPIGWIWTGPFPQVHTPRDTLDLVDKPTLASAGEIVWETVSMLRL